MTFFAPDTEKFKCLQLAYNALAMGGTATAILNAANEIAVQAFLDQKIAFHRIPELIERCLARHTNHTVVELEHTFEADRETREFMRTLF
jgi:1-deoxy-D-xylulose-5-phosphate reductoisomerase